MFHKYIKKKKNDKEDLMINLLKKKRKKSHFTRNESKQGAKSRKYNTRGMLEAILKENQLKKIFLTIEQI